MNNVTIKDIARELGIHHATVSRALRSKNVVKIETRELILKKASELGYIPNRLAQEFRNKRSNTIGVLVPDFQYRFFAKFISDFSKEADSSGFSVMVFQSEGKLKIEKQIVDSLLGYRIAGVIASVSRETTSAHHFDQLIRAGIPCVFFDRVPENSKSCSVMLDNFQAAYDAVTLLISLGRKRIAFVSTTDHINVFNDRYLGYRKALANGNIHFDSRLVVKEGLLMEDGFRAAKRLFELSEKPDAIFATRDELAIGVIKYLKKNGIHIPENVSVIGFDNDPMGIACEPELTTVDQLIPKMAAATFDLILRQINSDVYEEQRKVLKAEIIVRGSS